MTYWVVRWVTYDWRHQSRLFSDEAEARAAYGECPPERSAWLCRVIEERHPEPTPHHKATDG